MDFVLIFFKFPKIPPNTLLFCLIVPKTAKCDVLYQIHPFKQNIISYLIIATCINYNLVIVHRFHLYYLQR